MAIEGYPEPSLSRESLSLLAVEEEEQLALLPRADAGDARFAGSASL
jgi:hypothetical protein